MGNRTLSNYGPRCVIEQNANLSLLIFKVIKDCCTFRKKLTCTKTSPVCVSNKEYPIVSTYVRIHEIQQKIEGMRFPETVQAKLKMRQNYCTDISFIPNYTSILFKHKSYSVLLLFVFTYQRQISLQSQFLHSPHSQPSWLPLTSLHNCHSPKVQPGQS